MKTLLFNLGVSLLLTHEMDAMLRSEWQLLFVLRDMEQVPASWWFIYLHLPFYLAVLYLGNARNLVWRERFRFVVAGFMPIHAALHFRLTGHALYDFHHVLSQVTIYGAGLCGVAYLVLLWTGRNSRAG